MNAYMIIAIADNGTKTPVDMEFTTWDAACTLQEILEEVAPEFGYLIFTADEWMYEVENGNVLPS